MNSFAFENYGTNTYLVYTVGPEDVLDSMSLGMLTNNKIPGLAAVQFSQMDTTKYIKYNVSAHISVKQFFSGPVNKKRLLGVFNGIVDAMLSAEEYMIDTNSILLDMDYIFTDVSTCETYLVCLPILDMEKPVVDMGLFFKNIMFSTQFDQTENCDHIAKIMNYLNSSPVFSLADFKELLHNLDAGVQSTAQPVAPAPVQSQPSAQPVAPAPVQPQPVVKTEPSKTVPTQPVITKAVPAAVAYEDVAKPVPAVPVKPTQSQPAPAAPEKKISMLDLLTHYSKENAALYKAQKAAVKAAPAAAPTPTKSKATSPANVGFAVPGQAAPATKTPNKGFAIPGQPAPSPAAKKEFAVPNPPTPTGAPAVSSKPAVQPPVRPQTPSAVVAPTVPVAQPVVPAAPTYQAPPVPQGQAMNFGETTVLGGGNIGETTVLGAAPTAMQPKPHLIRSKNNEKINLDKPVFRIGKEKSYVDYFIGDNTAISRSHANVISRDGAYFVVDTNSTNHTYLNGVMIQSNEEAKLTHGDKIRLANEDFEFKLY